MARSVYFQSNRCRIFLALTPYILPVMPKNKIDIALRNLFGKMYSLYSVQSLLNQSSNAFKLCSCKKPICKQNGEKRLPKLVKGFPSLKYGFSSGRIHFFSVFFRHFRIQFQQWAKQFWNHKNYRNNICRLFSTAHFSFSMINKSRWEV